MTHLLIGDPLRMDVPINCVKVRTSHKQVHLQASPSQPSLLLVVTQDTQSTRGWAPVRRELPSLADSPACDLSAVHTSWASSIFSHRLTYLYVLTDMFVRSPCPPDAKSKYPISSGFLRWVSVPWHRPGYCEFPLALAELSLRGRAHALRSLSVQCAYDVGNVTRWMKTKQGTRRWHVRNECPRRHEDTHGSTISLLEIVVRLVSW